MLPVEVHTLLDATYPWPPEILGIYALLSEPLSLPTGWFDRPFPQALRPMLDQLNSWDLPTLPLSSDTQESHLRDVLTLSLYTVATFSSGGPYQSAVNIFIRGLAYACSKDAALLTDVSFVRPRTAVDKYGLDGQALFLACHILESPEQDQGSNESMDIDEEEEDSAGSSSETSYPTRVDSGSTSEGYARNALGFKVPLPPPPPSIDVSIDGHILPGCGKHTWAALPFLCVANQENINDLMSSTAYQRYVWGIKEPILGFLLSPTSVVATLFLSWVDTDTKILHIASADPQEHAVASFHFSDLRSTLRFAQFVLNLETRFAAVAERGSPLSENNKLDWRADNPKTQDPGTWRDRVDQWVRGVYLARTVDAPYPQHPNYSTHIHLCEELLEDMSAESSSKKAKQTEALLKPESAGDPSNQSRASSTPSLKYRSSSSYAGRSADGLPDKGRSDVLNWMLDRSVRRAGYHQHIPPNRPSDGPWIKRAISEINKHHSEMQALFAFRKPEQWEKERPSVDNAVESLLSRLLAQVAEKYAETPDSKPPVLDPEDAAFIGTRLSPALFACTGAQLHSLLQKQGLKVNEAENRMVCDVIIHLFYGEIFSLNVMLERSIHLCMNGTTASIDAGQFSSADFERRLKDNTNLHDNEVSSAWWHSLDTTAKLQATSAWHQAEYLERTWKAMGTEDIRNYLQRHDQQEPRTGTADAVLCVAVKRPETPSFTSADIRDLSFFEESTHEAVTVAPWQPAPENLPGQPVSLGPVAPKWEVIKRYLENPFIGKRTEAPSDISHVPNVKAEEVIFFPHVLVEYKKQQQDEGAALNQGRMYLVSALAYLYAVLGIKGRRLYCFVTSGKHVALIAGWKSSEDQDIFIFDRSVISFDLSSPIDIYYFATVLLRLREDQKDFKTVIEETLRNLDKTQLAELKKWRKSVQTPSEKTRLATTNPLPPPTGSSTPDIVQTAPPEDQTTEQKAPRRKVGSTAAGKQTSAKEGSRTGWKTDKKGQMSTEGQ